MPIFRVTYRSMSAFYGPSFIEAKDEYEARRKFAARAFRPEEMSLIHATPVSADDCARALRACEED